MVSGQWSCEGYGVWKERLSLGADGGSLVPKIHFGMIQSSSY